MNFVYEALPMRVVFGDGALSRVPGEISFLRLENVLVLALIVAIRTFLSFSLELEITGRWPWQKEPETQ